MRERGGPNQRQHPGTAAETSREKAIQKFGGACCRGRGRRGVGGGEAR